MDSFCPDLPLLPFQPNEVLVPSERKTLHLYEARFLALLEESLVTKKKLFVHFVFEPVPTNDLLGTSFAARYGCLVHMEDVERQEIGALVSIRGIGHVSIMKFVQTEPCLRGVVTPLQDNITDCPNKINSIIVELKEALYSLHSLQIKLKASKDELIQTPITNSLRWAEKEPIVDCDPPFIPSVAERISFSALQPISAAVVILIQPFSHCSNKTCIGILDFASVRLSHCCASYPDQLFGCYEGREAHYCFRHCHCHCCRSWSWFCISFQVIHCTLLFYTKFSFLPRASLLKCPFTAGLVTKAKLHGECSE